jgi:hypothetical protein
MPLYAADGGLNNAEFATGHDRVLCLGIVVMSLRDQWVNHEFSSWVWRENECRAAQSLPTLAMSNL